jgi:hypothetical protein
MENLNQEVKVKKEGTSQRKQANAASLALICYADQTYYRNTLEENKLLDMPVPVMDFMTVLEIEINDNVLGQSTAKVKNILAGHEHGDENGKCHYQCVIELTCRARITKVPGTLNVNGINLIYMYQEGKTLAALTRYCKKEKNYHWLRPVADITMVYKKDKNGNDTEKVDPFSTVVFNRDSMTKVEATEFLMSRESRTCFTSFKNIEMTLDSLLRKSDRPKFEWCWPTHMDKQEYSFIFKWFADYCVRDPQRKKALLLFSEERATGKTTFAKSLVNDEDYYVCFRNTFTAMPKNKEPKLLILDDMNFLGHGDQVEMWKALVAGESTSICAKYLNYEWDYNVPCIITTNSRSLVSFLASSTNFKTQIMFYEVRSYIGPEGTRPEGLDKVEMCVGDTLYQEIKAREEKKDEPKTKPIDLRGFVERAQLAQRVEDLEKLLAKATKKAKND